MGLVWVWKSVGVGLDVLWFLFGIVYVVDGVGIVGDIEIKDRLKLFIFFNFLFLC